MTLIELIIVITLIGILVIIGITYFRTQAFKGNDARRKSDIRRLQVAVEEYEKDKDCYPLSIPACSPGTDFRPYINKIPCDPVKSGLSYHYEPQESACPTWYRLYTVLDNKSDVDSTLSIGPYGAFNYEASSPNAPAPIVTQSTAPPAGGGGTPSNDYFACKGSACVPISWDPSIPGPDCHPNFRKDDCYGVCVTFDDCVPQN